MSQELSTPTITEAEPRETYKFSKWVEFFTDQKNQKTYGNGVQSVLAAYRGNMSYKCASNIACENMKKFKYMRQMYASKNGFTFEKFQKITITKFLRSEKPEWFDKVKEVTGFDELLPKTEKGQGVSLRTENKDGSISEVKIISFERPKEEKPE